MSTSLLVAPAADFIGCCCMCLVSPLLQVVRNFKAPAGVSADEVDAAGDGEVLVVLDLVQQEDLMEQGLARELVNRCGQGSGGCGSWACGV